VTDGEFTEIMALGRESSDVEFKGPGPLSNGRLVAQVVKAVLGMANKIDGGSVIIGMEDVGDSFNPIGLSDADLRTWTYDAVADQIARYADPSVSFVLETKENIGDRFVVLEVSEFSEIPVLCKRAYGSVLRDGACYVRTVRKPETTDIPTQADMRALLDLAIDKGMRRFIDRSQLTGLLVPGTLDPRALQQQRLDPRHGG
jgi:predicted HTH transcriptional regulator